MEKAEIKAIGDYLKDLEELRKIAKMKRCTKCKKRKAEGEFSKDRRNKDGLSYWCKKCDSESTGLPPPLS